MWLARAGFEILGFGFVELFEAWCLDVLLAKCSLLRSEFIFVHVGSRFRFLVVVWFLIWSSPASTVVRFPVEVAAVRGLIPLVC